MDSDELLIPFFYYFFNCQYVPFQKGTHSNPSGTTACRNCLTQDFPLNALRWMSMATDSAHMHPWARNPIASLGHDDGGPWFVRMRVRVYDKSCGQLGTPSTRASMEVVSFPPTISDARLARIERSRKIKGSEALWIYPSDSDQPTYYGITFGVESMHYMFAFVPTSQM